MRRSPRTPRITLQHKLTLSHAAVTLAAVLVAEGMALALIAGRPSQGLRVLLVTIGAALVGLLLGALVSRSVTRRLARALEVSRAWMRGNLSLRIADPVADDLGLLAGQLDLLAEHLEDDEEDLGQLREHNTRLTDQVRALAVVEERNRLARELHDSVKQHLFSLAMTASGVRAHYDAQQGAPADLAEMVREIETTAQAAQREMTRLIQDLRPGLLQDRGLGAALNDYTLLFGAREHILVYLEVQGNDALLPPPVAEALYRVAQEALHNVARHARATRADVHLRCIPEQVALTIEDNGVGFDATQTHQGLGLANMQERMMDIGGRLTVESRPGIGTTVLAEAALPHPLGVRPEIVRLDGDCPSPTIENWAWLGQRLVIPVGQTWPWLPADRVHLRRPLVDSGTEPLVVRREPGFLGFMRGYTLQLGQGRSPFTRVHPSRSGYEWEAQGASWALRRVRGLSGRMVLTRNGQPLAAMQHQGRLLNTWTEVVYDGRGYRFFCTKDAPSTCLLVDEAGDECLSVTGSDPFQIELRRALPLPLLVMVTMRFADEMAAITKGGGENDSS